ncbi:MAG: UvrD-helicase domain-containing protein [Bacteroidales bacterium]|nr:UvrD-helicase domain-containing protein [Bacteroidales bacterium]
MLLYLSTMLLDGLNQEQRQAASQIEGAVMIIAGAGSGKTRTLTYRVANLLEHGVSPYSIMVLTFTNKAAREMDERIVSLIGDRSKGMMMGTFHSVFMKILRIECERIGYIKSFSIYDTADSKSMIKNIVKDFSLDEKVYNSSYVLDRISKAKSSLISSEEYLADNTYFTEDNIAGKPQIGRIFHEYNARLRKNMAMDFDDLLFNTYTLLCTCPDIAEKYQRRFKYILVDEYQDTNHAQYAIIKILAKQYKNICVVGDDAQSIYAFRGANIQNILNFRKDYPDAYTFKLEQNYRSVSNIVNAANSVIDKNVEQIKKTIWTSNPEGEKIVFKSLNSDREEAEYVCNKIRERISFEEEKNYGNYAILYRTNSQSRAFEDALRLKNIPYKIYGGLSFYSRAEIKNVLGYFRLVVNNKDNEAFERIINYPARGIGQTTLSRLKIAAAENNLSFFETIYQVNLSNYNINSSTQNKLLAFCDYIRAFTANLHKKNAFELGEEIVRTCRIKEALKEENTAENIDRINNIEELVNSLQSFIENEQDSILDEATGEEISTDDKSLDIFLQQISLFSETDTMEENQNCVALMTIHSSKGLEFDNVFIVGMEENLFPSTLALTSKKETEEERRLFYVAMTRAKISLTLTAATMRYKYGQIIFSEKSRFVNEIDSKYIDSGLVQKKPLPSFQTTTTTPSTTSFVKKEKKPLPITSLKNNVITRQSLPSTNNATLINPNDLQVGMSVYHDKFGKGIVINIDNNFDDKRADVDFIKEGKKTLVLKFAKLKQIN